MSSASALASFVPVELARTLAPSGERDWSERRFPGAAVFADVSGFSRLADRLFRRYGTRGGELLTVMLTDFFGHLVELTTKHHGEIVKWSGDAFLAIWRGEPEAASSAAAACGFALAAHTHVPEQVPDVTLRVRSAVTCGELLTARVGGHQGRWELVVSGAPVRDIAGALHLAQPSTTVLSPMAARAVGGGVTPLANGHALLREAPSRPAAAPSGPAPADDESLFRSLVPPVVQRWLDVGTDRWPAEMRYVSSAFLLARDLDLEASGGAARLHDAVKSAQSAFDRHGGVLAQAGADDKGIWLLGGFGLPGAEGERRDGDVLRAAWETRDALLSLGLGCSGGVASGRAYCGLVGNETRREFTFTSRVVNLSARLMSRTPDTILVDAETAGRTRSAATLVERPAEALAGFDERVATFALTRVQNDVALAAAARSETSGPVLVGRDAEQARLLAALDAVRARRRACVLLEGATGVGKTALARETAARASDLRVVFATAERATQTTPYGAFREIFGAILGTPTHAESDAERRTFGRELLMRRPDLEEDAALLDVVLPVTVDERDETRALSGVARAESARRLLLTILEQAAASGPLLLVVEDAHWLDGMSWKLLVTAVSQLESAAFVVTSRPAEADDDDRARLLELAHAELISLAPLDLDSVAALAEGLLGGSVPAHLAAWLVGRTGGNPFFVHELVQKLIEEGHIERGAGEVRRVAGPAALEAVTVPLDVESVVTSRLDRLPAEHQRVMKAASVVGRTFTAEMISRALIEPLERAGIDAALDALERAELIERFEDGWRFGHDTLQRVPYELVPESDRRTMHRAIAELFEKTRAGDPAYVTLLAHHWDRADDDERALEALEAAAAQAMRAGAFREAHHFLGRAMARIGDDRERGRTIVTAEREARWARDRSEAAFQIGEIAQSCADGERSLALLGRRIPASPAGWALLTMRELLLQTWRRWVPARRAEPGDERARAMVRAVGRLAEAYVFANHPEKMVALALWAANQTGRAGRGAALAQPYAILGLTAGMIRLRGIAQRYFELADAAAAEAGEPTQAIGAMFLRALYLHGLGSIAPWQATLDRAYALAARSGIDHQADVLRMGMAFHAWILGRYPASLAYVAETRASSQRRYDEQLAGWCLLSSASCLERLGAFELAATDLERAGTMLERLGDVAIQSNVDGLGSLIQLRVGDARAARQLAEASVARFVAGPPTSGMAITAYSSVARAATEMWVESGVGARRDPALEKLATAAGAQMDRFARMFPVGTATAHVHRGELRHARGDLAGAVREWKAAVAVAPSIGGRWEEGVALSALARHGPAAEREAAAQRAGTILREIGCRYELEQLERGS